MPAGGAGIRGWLSAIWTKLNGSIAVTGTFWQATQPVSAASLPLPSGASTKSTLAGVLTTSDFDTKTGSLTETAPASDTASSGLNGRLQRIAQRLSSLIALLPTSLGANGGLKIEGVASGTAVPVSIASVPSHAVTNAGTFAVQATEADGANTTLGSKADAKNSASDTTSITIMQVLKQISFSIQAAATSLAGTLTVAAHAVTQSGTWNVTVNAAIAAGTNIIGKFGIDQTTPGTTNGVTPVPASSGGPSEARIMAAASTNATSTKGSAGQLYGWYLYNNTSSAKFFKFYNKASSPTVGTDTPARTISIPANGGSNIEFSMGIPMATGIAYAITGGIADSDTTSVAANDVTGFFLYK